MLEDKTETNKSPTLEMIIKYWYGLVYKNPLKFFTNINFQETFVMHNHDLTGGNEVKIVKI